MQLLIFFFEPPIFSFVVLDRAGGRNLRQRERPMTVARVTVADDLDVWCGWVLVFSSSARVEVEGYLWGNSKCLPTLKEDFSVIMMKFKKP